MCTIGLQSRFFSSPVKPNNLIWHVYLVILSDLAKRWPQTRQEGGNRSELLYVFSLWLIPMDIPEQTLADKPS